MNEILELIDELKAHGLETGLRVSPETQVGTEMISFQALRTHFEKANNIALKVLGYFANPEDYRIVSLSLRDITLNKNLVNDGYIALKDIEVFKASGFIGNVRPFVGLLEKNTEQVKSINPGLVLFEKTLGEFVMNPETLSKTFTGLHGSKLPSGTKFLDELRDYFVGKSGIDTAPLKALYRNLGEVIDSGKILLELTQKFNSENVRDIKDRGDNLYRTLDYMEDALADKNLEMSDDWRKAIGKELYTITEWLAIYSLYLTKLIAVSVAHRDSVLKLNQI